VVQPAIVVILRENDGRLKQAGLFGAPDLAIEILSPSTEDRDRTLKMRVYAKKGVRELWIADPVASLVEIYVLEKNRLVKVREHESGEVRSVVVLPGFAVALAAIIKPA
jgi:Uma2 family endonuclease